MSKTETEDVKKIKSSFLRKHQYFCGIKSGTITWTRSGYGARGDKSSVGIVVSTLGDEKYIQITYTQTDNYSGEKKDFDYKIPLITTGCNFGGVRYWFKCTLSRNGVYCGRRVGVLFKDGDWFGCRHCYRLAYPSQNLSGMAKYFGRFLSDNELEAIRVEIKGTHYRGKPTKRYLRYLRESNQAEESFAGMIMYFHGKTEKVLNANKRKK